MVVPPLSRDHFVADTALTLELAKTVAVLLNHLWLRRDPHWPTRRGERVIGVGCFRVLGDGHWGTRCGGLGVAICRLQLWECIRRELDATTTLGGAGIGHCSSLHSVESVVEVVRSAKALLREEDKASMAGKGYIQLELLGYHEIPVGELFPTRVMEAVKLIYQKIAEFLIDDRASTEIYQPVDLSSRQGTKTRTHSLTY